LQNVKEHAPPLAGAHVETGVDVHDTQDVDDSAASGGCVSRLVRCSYSDEEWRDIETSAQNLGVSVIQYIELRARSRDARRERVMLPPSKWWIGKSRTGDKLLVVMFANRAKDGRLDIEYEVVEESSLPVDLIRQIGSEYCFNLTVALQLNTGVEEVGVSVGSRDNETLVGSLDGCFGISPDFDPVLIAGGVHDGKVAEGCPSCRVGGHVDGVSENSSTNVRALAPASK